MALVTTNFTAAKTGVYLNKAYAILGDMTLNRKSNYVRATFLIHADRAALNDYAALDEVTVHFTWDRKQNIVEQAYNAAKTQLIEVFDETEMKTKTIHGKLYGWEDEIQ